MADEKSESLTIESIVGRWGPVQRRLLIFYTTVYIISPFQNLGIIFYAPKINYTCIDSLNNQIDSNAQDQCWLNNSTKCEKWQYDKSVFKSTIVEEFDLVCDRAWLVSTGSSLYYIGYAVSSLFFGYVSDNFGRLKALKIAFCFEIIAGVSQALSISIYQFLISRLFLGIFAYGRYLSGLILILEWVGSDLRANVSIAIEMGWTIGLLVLPVMAYVLPHFRYLQGLISGLEALSLLWLWSIPESPRWQVSRGLFNDAHRTLKKAMEENGTADDIYLERVLAEFKRIHHEEKNTVNMDEKRKQSILELWKVKDYLKYSIALYIMWFSIAFISYGLYLNVGDLGGNLFINSFIFGVAELVSKILLIFAFYKFGRKILMIIFLFGGGIGCLLVIPFIDKSYGLVYRVTFAMIGKFFISCAFHVIYVYSAEIFPTSVRQFAVGSCSVSSRIGSMIAPFLKEFSQLTSYGLTMSIYATTAIISGLVAILLPETRHKEIPDTVEDVEDAKNKKAEQVL